MHEDQAGVNGAMTNAGHYPSGESRSKDTDGDDSAEDRSCLTALQDTHAYATQQLAFRTYTS